MSNRCRVLVFSGLLGAILGTLREQDTLAILSLAMLFWIFVTWSLFTIRISLLWPGIKLDRSLNGQYGEKVTLWSDRSVWIGARITSTSGNLPPLCTLSDTLPELLRLQSGEYSQTIVRPVELVEIRYQCLVLAAGRLKLPGIHFQFRDPQGLFVTERFLAQSTELRSLPSFADVRDSRSSIKRVNSLPQHGIHRMQRAGLGSELLELREYQPGDPPKSIAWKVSARRDRLMTRQYESEVPVRITLFVDGSDVNRIGGFGLRQLDQMNYMAASVARSTISAGDSLGLVLVNDEETHRLAPSFGERAFYQVLDALSKFAGRPPRFSSTFTLGLQSSGAAVAQRRFPELMSYSVNRIPFAWLPLLPWNRQVWRKRVQLAGLMGSLYELSPRTVCELCWDDPQMAQSLQRFLWDNGWACMPPLGREHTRAGEIDGSQEPPPADARLMAEALTKSVASARDNEVFVILANLFNREQYVSQLQASIKMAVARHHRVVLLCTRPIQSASKLIESALTSADIDAASAEHRVLLKAEGIEIDDRLMHLKRQLRKVGAKVAVASQRNAITLVLAEAELAGRGRTIAGGSQ